MSSLNKIMIIGRLGRDPESRPIGNNPRCSFSVATSESWKDKTTGEKKEKTEWHKVVTYGTLADIAGRYLKKGSLVYVEGKIQTREWEARDETKKYITEILAREIQFLDSKKQSQAEYEDDIPF